MSASHLSPRQWRVPLTAFTMAIVVGCYVHFARKSAKRQVDFERQVILDEQKRQRDARVAAVLANQTEPRT